MPIAIPDEAAIPAGPKRAKLAAYAAKIDEVITTIGSHTDANFDTEFKKLPLLVHYEPRVGGKSRRRNNKKNKSRRRNQSKRQRK